MLSLITKNLKLTWKSFLVYALVFVVYSWMMVAIFPSMQSALGDINQFYDAMPEGFMSAFGGVDMDMSSFNTYISLEYLSIVWPFVILAFIVGFVTRYITKEIETGTMELLLSKPITRLQIILSRGVVVVLETMALILVTIGSIVALTQIYNIEILGRAMWFFAVSAFAFYLAIIGITFFFATLFKDRGKALSASIGLLIGMYAINIITNLKESLKNIDYITIWHYYQPQEILKNVEIYWFPDILVLVAVGVIAYLASVVIFIKRDL